MPITMWTGLLCTLAAVVASQDTELVESTVQQVVAEAPKDLLAAGTRVNVHGQDGDDKGYHLSQATRGDDGYKNFDSFHKKDGDSYGYEKHAAFGGADDGGSDGGQYHESSAYSTGHKPRVTAYHYETASGTPREHSGADEDEGYDGSEVDPRYLKKTPKDVEVRGELRGPKSQSLGDASGQPPPPRKRKVIRKKSKVTPAGEVKEMTGEADRAKEPTSAATEDEGSYYDSYYDGESDGDGYDGEYESDYEGGEADYY